MKRLIPLVIVVLALFFGQADTSHAWSGACHYPSSRQLASLPTQYPSFYRALRAHFRSQWRNAAITSWAEGSWNPYAKNGQYLGTFQMGSWARSNYGHSYTLAGQVAAAARNWRENGWSQWECAVPWV